MKHIKHLLIAMSMFLSWQTGTLAQTVQFSFSTSDPEGPFSPMHVMAVWVEDGNGQFIKTLLVEGKVRSDYLVDFQSKSKGFEVDAMTGPTRQSHGSVAVSWDCKNIEGIEVRDRKYVLAIEFTDKNGPGPVYRAAFKKGDKPLQLSFPNQEMIKNISLVYRPDASVIAEPLAENRGVENHLGEMINIPAGYFIMGNDSGRLEERPAHQVYLVEYQIGKYEVTRGEYRQFMEAGGYENPQYWSPEGWVWKEGNVIVYAGMYGSVNYGERKNTGGKRNAPEHWEEEQEWIGHDYGHPVFRQTDAHPVVGVTYYEAEAYCKWAGGRLPTEAEYEKACRWTGSKSNLYPWGDVWDPEKNNNPHDHNPAGGGYLVNQSAPVGSYPEGASPYGVQDMTGNAYEWCADFMKSYPGSEETFDFTGKYHVVKGGCWDDPDVNCSFRAWYLPPSSHGVGGNDSDIIGFRIAK